MDLSNPKVQDYVFSVVDNILTETPDLAFFNWDGNRPITNVYSPYLKEKQNQSAIPKTEISFLRALKYQ